MSREMKESGIQWIGDMPAEWICNRVKLHLHVNHGSDPHTEGNIPVYGSGTESFKTCGEYKIGPAILLGRKGSIENPRYVEEKFWNVDTAFDAEVYSDDMLPKFFYYLACVFDYKSYISQTTLPSMTQGDYKNMNIPVPPLPEQQAISAFLDLKCSAIDDSITKHKAIIDKLEEYKKAVITKAVTKGLDPDAKMKDSGMEWIGEVPEGWEIRPLKFTSDSISKGNGITKDDVVEDGDMQCVRYGEIYFQYDLSFSQCKSKTRLNKVSSPQFFSYGDILCAGTGELIDEIGKPIVYLGDQNCLAGGDIVIVKHKQNPRFLEYALSSSYAQAQRSLGKYKLKVVHISAGEIGSIKIALPNITEQNRIADYLDNKIADITKVIDNKLAVISKWEEYKKSLIYYAVTGKIDCRNEVL